ncbi:hypothetical protein GCM10023189_35410 [Nibrella saemangeumensis]|uniref:Uncharacterized protein n=1 Tax=Nibrella saemangeumensis TaxID=1084526 RepID=A0ABP8N5S2_9BACT
MVNNQGKLYACPSRDTIADEQCSGSKKVKPDNLSRLASCDRLITRLIPKNYQIPFTVSPVINDLQIYNSPRRQIV